MHGVDVLGCPLEPRTFFFGAAFFLSGEALPALAGAASALRAAPVPRRALPASADRSTALPCPLASLQTQMFVKAPAVSHVRSGRLCGGPLPP